MSSLVPFDFEGIEVRFFSTEDGSFEVVARDVAYILGYEDAGKFANLVDDEYKYLRQIGLSRNTTTLTEPGFYQGLARSNKPKAKPFQRWVYEVVLPSIRKTGSYGLQQQVMPSHVEALRGWADAEEGRLLAEAKVVELTPKAEVADRFIERDDDTVTFTFLAGKLRTSGHVLKKFCRQVHLFNNSCDSQ